MLRLSFDEFSCMCRDAGIAQQDGEEEDIEEFEPIEKLQKLGINAGKSVSACACIQQLQATLSAWSSVNTWQRTPKYFLCFIRRYQEGQRGWISHLPGIDDADKEGMHF